LTIQIAHQTTQFCGCLHILAANLHRLARPST